MKLEDYGFKEEYIKSNSKGLPARIITTFRDRYEFISDRGIRICYT